MELWIRSQDKICLTKVSHLYIDDNNHIRQDNDLILGTYGEKRALEVLDEIQEAQLGNYHYRCPSNVKLSNNENTIVYEMPK